MTAKTDREEFDGAIATLKKLEAKGYDCGPVKRLMLSATGRVKEPEPAPKADKPKTVSTFLKDKDEAKS